MRNSSSSHPPTPKQTHLVPSSLILHGAVIKNAVSCQECHCFPLPFPPTHLPTHALTPSRARHRDNPPPGTTPHGCYSSTRCGVPPDKPTRGTLMTPKAILREGQQGLLLANLLQQCTNTQQKTKKPTPNLKCRPRSSHPMPSAAATNPAAPGW